MRLDRLKSALGNSGLNQTTLAKRVGCSQGAIQQIMDGRTKNTRLLPDIASALGVSMRWLQGSTDDAAPSQDDVIPNKILADQLNLTLVRELELGYSMGGGSVLEQYTEAGFRAFDSDFLRRISKGGADKLFVATGDGDSMNPTLYQDDTVLIDTAQMQITQQDRIWAISYGELGMIKRIRRLPSGRFLVISDNATIAPFEASEEEMHVVGRVIWIGRRM